MTNIKALTPKDIGDMTDEELETLTTTLQSRRLRFAQVYNDTMDVKRKARREAITESIEKKLIKYKKVLDRIEKDLGTLAATMNNVRALRLEMDDGV